MSQSLAPVRVPEKLAQQIAEAASSRGVSIAAWQREAFRLHLNYESMADQIDSLEDRMVATLSRSIGETRQARNDTQMVIAILDTFVRVYLLHTPPIPQDAVRAAAASADDRHKKFVNGSISTIRGETGLLERLRSALDRSEADVDGEA